MSLKYCALCKRNVEPRRKFGIGTIIMILLTGLLWILVLPFYRKRCPICKTTLLSGVENSIEDKKVDEIQIIETSIDK